MAFSIFYFFKITYLDETKRRSSSLSLSLAKNFQWDFMHILELINFTDHKEELCIAAKVTPVVRLMKFQLPILISHLKIFHFLRNGYHNVTYTGRQLFKCNTHIVMDLTAKSNQTP